MDKSFLTFLGKAIHQKQIDLFEKFLESLDLNLKLANFWSICFLLSPWKV